MLILYKGEAMELEERAAEIRKMIFKMAYRGGTGHLASAFSITEVLTVLYFGGILNIRPKEPEWKQRDKVILSKGHASLALYSVLAMAGFFPAEELKTFCKPKSEFGGEPRMGHVPGVEATTGSLGHGLSFGTGIAMAHRMNGEKNRTYVILGDGECQEGSIWEAVISAAHHKLDYLTVILDYNKLQAMGKLEDILAINRMKECWEDFGWETREVDGHDINQLKECLAADRQIVNGKPHLIIANTIKGKGISFMENVPIWHYRMPNEQELEIVLHDLNMTKEELLQCEMHI